MQGKLALSELKTDFKSDSIVWYVGVFHLVLIAMQVFLSPGLVPLTMIVVTQFNHWLTCLFLTWMTKPMPNTALLLTALDAISYARLL